VSGRFCFKFPSRDAYYGRGFNKCLVNFQKSYKIFANIVEHLEHMTKDIIQTLVVQSKVVLVNMLSSKNKSSVLKKAIKLLSTNGYTVEPIMCGECEEDDLLVQVHTCISFDEKDTEEYSLD